VKKFADSGARPGKTLAVDLSKAVACTALLIMIVLSAGHALANPMPSKNPEAQGSETAAHNAARAATARGRE
jgi:hypothetical protein